jgi:hypothetical protein
MCFESSMLRRDGMLACYGDSPRSAFQNRRVANESWVRWEVTLAQRTSEREANFCDLGPDDLVVVNAERETPIRIRQRTYLNSTVTFVPQDWALEGTSAPI